MAINYTDKHRGDLQHEYKDAEEFNTKFKVDEGLTNDMVAFARKQGIEPDSAGLAHSGPLIDLRLKALIARDVWGSSAYWQIINSDNPVDHSFKEALRVIGDDALQRAKLAEK
jgi:carboxyl-terminal processing protease